MLGNVMGGLSGPLPSSRSPYGPFIRRPRPLKTPIIGIGGIATIDDVMEFLVAGALAIQLAP